MKFLLVVALLAYLLVAVCTAASLRRMESEPHPKPVYYDRGHSLVKRDLHQTANDTLIIAAAAGGGGALLLILLAVLITSIICFCVYRRKKREQMKLLGGGPVKRYHATQKRLPAREPGVAEAMNRQRREKEQQEKKKAEETVQYFLRNNTEYKFKGDLRDLGSRMQKHWFKAIREDDPKQDLLLTTTPVSQKCPLKLEKEILKGLNKLVKELKKHPFLQPVMTVDYLAAQQQLVVVQLFHERGSLKDTIYRATPSTDWSNKYSRRSKGLNLKDVRLYGRQILEAMVFLYDRGFPTLGHVQSGNVFVVDGVSLLGGYENTLLGYKTRLYRLCKDHLEHLDVIMFGHLLFEMCCGYELTHIAPGEGDYETVKGKDDEREILRYIFAENFPHGIRDIRDHPIFSVDLPQLAPEKFDPASVNTSGHRSIESVLEKVRKGKARHQKVPKQKKDDDATPTPTPAPPTAPPTMPPPKDSDKTPIGGGDGATMDSGTLTGDSTGEQSGDGKRKKSKLGIKLGRKKDKGAGAVEAAVGDEDKTPVVHSMEEPA